MPAKWLLKKAASPPFSLLKYYTGKRLSFLRLYSYKTAPATLSKMKITAKAFIDGLINTLSSNLTLFVSCFYLLFRLIRIALTFFRYA